MTRMRELRSYVSRRVRSNDRGFTLAEVVVSMGLFVTIMAATTTALVTVIKSTRFTRDRVAAASIARQTIERLRSENNTGHSLDIGTLPTTVAYGITYTATVCMTMDADNTTQSCTAVPACADGHKWNVTVSVDWNGSESRKVTYDTVLAC